MTEYVDPYIDLKGSKQLPDGRWEHCFTQSFLNTFMQCPEQARAAYFKETTFDDTDSTALGKAVHAGIEYGLHEKRDSRVPSLDEMVEVTINELDTIGEWKYTKLSKPKVYQLPDIMLGAFYDKIMPHVEPVLIENTFRVPLYSGKHRDVFVGGTMDCVDDEGIVWDWKTASRPYERWEKQRWAIQPTIYTYANDGRLTEESTARNPDEGLPKSLFRYGIMLHDGHHQILDVWRDETHIAWLRQIASQIAWLIEHDVKPWPLNDHGWHCSERWCGLWSECKGKFIHADWKSSA